MLRRFAWVLVAGPMLMGAGTVEIYDAVDLDEEESAELGQSPPSEDVAAYRKGAQRRLRHRFA